MGDETARLRAELERVRAEAAVFEATTKCDVIQETLMGKFEV